MRRPWIMVCILTAAFIAGATTAGADTSPDPPLTDPIPAPITMSGLEVRLEHVATIPASGTSPLTRINTAVAAGDGSGRLFVPDLRGDLWVVDGGSPAVYLDVPSHFPDFVDAPRLGTGLGYVAFDPDFATNGRFYTVHTEDGAALTSHTPDFVDPLGTVVHGVITEWTAADSVAATFAGTTREVMRVGFATYFHGFQQIGFGPDGFLYLATGDGVHVPLFSPGPQDLGQIQGKLLRIDPGGTDSANGAYGIPALNPFVGTAGALGEIWAYGFRNPHRFSWDETSGKLLLGNIGESNIDMVHQVLPQANHGWTEREGTFLFDPSDPENVYPLPVGDAAFGYTYPVAQYDHDEGFAIVGGFVHRHPSIPELYGEYVFGDIVNGRVFHATESAMTLGADPAPIGEIRLFDETDTEVTLLELVGESRVDLRVGMDEDGTILLLSKRSGDIWRLTDRTPQPLPTITPGLVEVTEAPGGVVASIPLALSSATPLPVSVDIATLIGPPGPTWASGPDHVASSATVHFAPGTTTASFDVTITDDEIDEADELLLAATSGPVNATIGGLFGLGFVRIVDDDESPVITPGLVAVVEGAGGPSTVVEVPFTLSAPSGLEVRADWATLDLTDPGLAGSGSGDFVSAAGEMVFAPGATATTVAVTVLDDTLAEANEWMLVASGNPTNATVGGFFGLALGVIFDDD